MTLAEFVDYALKALGAIFGFIILFGKPLYDLAKGTIEKWLDRRFQERLANLKNEHDRQLRHLQAEIDREVKRAARVHEREFDTLAKTWDLMIDAYWLIAGAIHPVREGVNFVGIGKAMQDDIIQNATDMTQAEKNEILALPTAEERTKGYETALDWHILVKCKRARIVASEYVEKNGIFLRPEIKTLFIELDRLMINVLEEHHENLLRPGASDRELGNAYREHGGAIMQGIEKRVHERLWSSVPT